MSKIIYLGVYTLSVLLFLLFTCVGLFLALTTTPRTEKQLFTMIAVFGAIQLLIVQMVLTFMLLYKMWSSINDGQARTTPGKAIGFLFIPFFNLYWLFQVWGGFPEDFNKYVERYHLTTPHLSSGIYIIYPILILLSIIPFINLLCAFIGVFVFAAIIWKTCDAVSQLQKEKGERQAAASRMPFPNQPIEAIQY